MTDDARYTHTTIEYGTPRIEAPGGDTVLNDAAVRETISSIFARESGVLRATINIDVTCTTVSSLPVTVTVGDARSD